MQTILAQFLGVAGFLPTKETLPGSSEARAYTKNLWDIWWKYRSELEDKVLTPGTWKLSNIRPANHPQRRLAAMATLAAKRRANGIARDDLTVETGDSFWTRHFTLGGPKQKKASALIGETRAREIEANVLLPFAFAAANAGDEELGKRTALEAFEKCRPLESNNVLRLASHQLLGAHHDARQLLNTACRQQGLHQVFQDFCLNDRSACQQCLFPQLVANWKFERNELVGQRTC
jgi:hypothetical protein